MEALGHRQESRAREGAEGSMGRERRAEAGGLGVYGEAQKRTANCADACFLLPQDLVGNGALVSIANKYGETPIDKAKTPLREVLKGNRFSS